MQYVTGPITIARPVNVCRSIKAPNFSAFYWSPQGSLVSTGQHFVITRVEHLPKRTETSLITVSEQSGPNHRIEPGCGAVRGCRLHVNRLQIQSKLNF